MSTMRLPRRRKILIFVVFVAFLTFCHKAGKLSNTVSYSWLQFISDYYNGSVVVKVPSSSNAAQRVSTCGQLHTRFPDSIPPLLHWTSKDGRIPAKLVSTVLSWRRLLNETAGGNSSDSVFGDSTAHWQFMHWNDQQIAKLVTKHYPLLNQSYAKLANGLERSDIGRLVVLHHVGGMYVDTDVELLRDPSPFLHMPSHIRLSNESGNRSTSCCTAVWAQEPVEHAIFIYNMPKLISNAVILSRANHSFLSFVLNTWPAWFEDNWANRTKRDHTEAVRVTGPLMLHQLFDKYMALHPGQRPSDWSGTWLAEPDLFQPRFDEPNLINRLKKACAAQSKSDEAKKRHCKRLALTKFKNQPLPKRSLTVHGFKHLSYTHKMDFTNSKRISSLLPILNCQL